MSTEGTPESVDIDCRFTGRIGQFNLDVAFNARGPGITALFGPSGSGKTSILRCLAGLTRLNGFCRVGGGTWQDDATGCFVPPHRREVGYVFQDASLFNHLSVLRNLRFGARRGNGIELDREAQIIELLNLKGLLKRSCKALSGGERQRVAIGRALLSAPRVLLMDEPVSALDRRAKEEILPYFEVLRESIALPIVYVSHDLAEVARLADQMVVISAGRKIAEGRVHDILERLDLYPETGRFEAGVVLSATIVGHNRGYKLTNLDVDGQQISIPEIDASAGEMVRVRIRARDVALATRKPEGISIRNVLKGTVAQIAPETDTAFAETLVDIGGGRLRARITREALAQLAISEGSSVYALIKTISFDRRTVAAGRDGGAGEV